MILCVTPNAAIDRTLIVSKLEPGVAARPKQTIVVAGGKGFNVARAIHGLGGQAMCAGFLGGHTGRLIADLARQEGLPGRWTWLEAESRTCTIIVEEANNQVLEICETGPTISTHDWHRLQADILRAAEPAAYVCLCGSLPPGCPPHAPADLIGAIQAMGRPVWVDTSGPALRGALAAKPAGLKVNAVEASALLGQAITGAESAFEAAVEFRQKGVGMVVLTLGPQGAVLVNETGGWWAHPPAIQSVSPVGSGDSFLAGLVTGLAAKLPPPDALDQAVAAGTANALSPGGAQFSLSDFNRLLAETQVSPITGQKSYHAS